MLQITDNQTAIIDGKELPLSDAVTALHDIREAVRAALTEWRQQEQENVTLTERVDSLLALFPSEKTPDGRVLVCRGCGVWVLARGAVRDTLSQCPACLRKGTLHEADNPNQWFAQGGIVEG